MFPLKNLLIVAGIGSALIFGTASLAQEHPAPPMPRPDHHEGGPMAGGPMGGSHRGRGLAVLDQLDLSQAQKDSVRGILEGAHSKMKAVHDDMQKSRKALEGLTPDDSKYSAAVTQAAQDEGAAVTKMVQLRASTRADIYKQLTADQKTKLQKIKADMEWHHAIGGMFGGEHHKSWGHPGQ